MDFPSYVLGGPPSHDGVKAIAGPQFLAAALIPVQLNNKLQMQQVWGLKMR